MEKLNWKEFDWDGFGVFWDFSFNLCIVGLFFVFFGKGKGIFFFN